jgi:uncharacterized protein with HEPN domain
MQRDAAYLLDIVDSARLILAYVAAGSRDDFLREVALQDQVIRRFEIIGEAARHVSAETRARFPGISWRAMVGLRNVLIHEYGEVNLERLWDVIQGDLPELIRTLEPEVPPPPDSH